MQNNLPDTTRLGQLETNPSNGIQQLMPENNTTQTNNSNNQNSQNDIINPVRRVFGSNLNEKDEVYNRKAFYNENERDKAHIRAYYVRLVIFITSIGMVIYAGMKRKLMNSFAIGGVLIFYVLFFAPSMRFIGWLITKYDQVVYYINNPVK